MPKTVLLDIDGTLLDSNAAHARAWVDAFAEHGREVPFDSLHGLIGMGGDKVLDKVAPGLSEEEGEGHEITQLRKKIFLDRYIKDLKPTPGARTLVERIKAEGMKPVIATSASGEELEALLKQAGVADLIETQATSDDANQTKPDPDIIDAALEKSQSRPEESIMIGDTPYDVESAKKAGVRMIAVRCGGHDSDLQGADAVYDDPADLVRHWNESPLVRDR